MVKNNYSKTIMTHKASLSGSLDKVI